MNRIIGGRFSGQWTNWDGPHLILPVRKPLPPLVPWVQPVSMEMLYWDVDEYTLTPIICDGYPYTVYLFNGCDLNKELELLENQT